MNLDRDLYRKFQERVKAMKEGDTFLQEYDDLLTKMLTYPLCKKCMRCYLEESADIHNMPHHKNVVRPNEKTNKSRLCRYVVCQKWFDLLVNNKEKLMGERNAEIEAVRDIMIKFHTYGIVSPNCEWHYWQLFRERIPGSEQTMIRNKRNVVNVSEKTEGGVGLERYKKYLAEEEAHVSKKPFVDESSFLMFFMAFYVKEFGYLADKVQVEQLSMETTFRELIFDQVGLVNLYTAVHDKYAHLLKMRFEGYVIPFSEFDKCECVGDLYKLVCK